MGDSPRRTGDCPVPTTPDGPTSDVHEPSGAIVHQDLGAAPGARADGPAAWTKFPRSADGAVRSAPRQEVCIHPDALITPLQRDLVQNFASRLEDPHASVVITNPRERDNPIVYVTERWQSMCGFTYDEAVGRNPRLTQGTSTNQDAVRTLKDAIAKQSACKVQIVNYRGGEHGSPFWNMLSINPIVYRGKLMLYAASLQDYSYHMDKLISLTPSQFCRALEHYQRGRYVDERPLTALQLAKPTVHEADAAHPLITPARAAHVQSTTTPRPIKRLGWTQLAIEPEHLRDRVADALQTIGVKYELVSRADCEGEILSIHAVADGLAMRVMIAENSADGLYECAPTPLPLPTPAPLTASRCALSVTVTRVSGDTFKFHEIYRELRGHLSLIDVRDPDITPAESKD